MDEIIKEYLKNHLSISVKIKDYGFNGKCVSIELMIDEDVISEDSFDIYKDEG